MAELFGINNYNNNMIFSFHFLKTHKSLFILLVMNMAMIIILDQMKIDNSPMITGSESKDHPFAVIASKALTGAVIGNRGPLYFSNQWAASRGQINPVRKKETN